jgi:proteic killer suppression protein
MIKSFRHRGLKRLYENDDRSRLRPDLAERIAEILALLETATTPQAMNHPVLHLHALKGELKGFWSVTVRANWRVIFRFDEGNVRDVDLIDYH